MDVVHELTRKRVWHWPNMHDLAHKGEHFGHMAYLGLVSVESHYWYRFPALFLFVLAFAMLFVKEAHE